MDTVEEINSLCIGTMIDHLGIEFTTIGADFLEAKMPVDRRTIQPMKILHGGASLALAETMGSVGSFLLIDRQKQNVVGVQMTGNHIAPASSGFVYGYATLLHKGSKTHIWDIRISDETGKIISVCRLTNMVIKKK